MRPTHEYYCSAHGKQEPEHSAPAEAVGDNAKPVGADGASKIAKAVDDACPETRVYTPSHINGENTCNKTVETGNKEIYYYHSAKHYQNALIGKTENDYRENRH